MVEGEFEVSAPGQFEDRKCRSITQCTMDEFEAAAPTATSDRECKPHMDSCDKLHETPCRYLQLPLSQIVSALPYPSCDPNQYVANPGSCGADRCGECHPSCDGESGCTGPSAKECNECANAEHENECVNSCPEGFEKSSKTGKCIKCQGGADCDCGAGEFLNAKSLCQTCKKCTANEWMRNACSDFEQTDCARLTECWINEYEIKAPTPTSNRECLRVTPPCESGFYESTKRTKTSDRVCSQVTECSSDQYQSKKPTKTSDRVCIDKPKCDLRTEYLNNKNVCATIAVCNDEQFEAAPATPTSNRQCRSLTKCTKNQFESVPPTSTSDRECERVSIKYWKTSSWSECPTECGENDDGTLMATRDVQCTDKADGEPVDGALCPSNKPATEACPPTKCYTYEYEYGEYGTCSEQCGEQGTQTREEFCMRISSTGESRKVAKSLCADAPRSATSRKCNIKPCHWSVSEWGECTQQCDEGAGDTTGIRTREVYCYNPNSNKRSPRSLCLDDDGVRPSDAQECNTYPCEDVIDDDDEDIPEGCTCLQTWQEREDKGRSFYELVTETLPKQGRAVLNASSAKGFCEYKWDLSRYCKEDFTENELLEITNMIDQLRVECDMPMYAKDPFGADSKTECNVQECNKKVTTERTVLCVKDVDGKPVELDEAECIAAGLTKPVIEDTCFGPPCIEYEWKSINEGEWSACSNVCGGGVNKALPLLRSLRRRH